MNTPLPHASSPLAHILRSAAEAVQAVRGGRSLTDALAPYARHPARAAIQSVSYDAIRALALAQALQRGLVQRPLTEPIVEGLLLVSLALLSMDDPRPYTDHTVVHQTVAALEEDGHRRAFKGLANGVLRSFLRERAARLQQARQDPTVRWNVPTWWLKRVQKAYPETWENILAVSLTRPPMSLRINPRHIAPQIYVERLLAAGMQIAGQDREAVVLSVPVPVQQLPDFEQGACSVQDVGAQWAAHLLDAQPGMRLLDACAAPGGKTLHLLERVDDIHMIALDADAQRLKRVADNLARAGLSAQLVVGDATQPDAWWDGQPFDRILLDAPCTASGIVRRHPDIPWLRREHDIAQLAQQQRDLLQALWPLLQPGGQLLYVTCSIFPEEAEEQAQAFVSAHTDAQRLDAPGQVLPTALSNAGEALLPHDGFFYALFRKNMG